MRKFVATLAAVAVCAVVVVASPAGAADAGSARFCALNFETNQHFNSEPGEDASPKQVKAFTRKAKSLLTKLANAAPPEIESPVDTVTTAFKADLEGAFDDPAVQQGIGEIDEWALDNCDYEVVDVTAADYSFAGVPDSLSTGKTVFSFTNTGTELHEMIIFRIKTDTALEDLLAEEKRFDKEAAFVGAAFGPPGETSSGYAELEKAGRYVAVCFIPVGTTGFDTEGSGPPHFMEGMVTEFTVEKA